MKCSAVASAPAPVARWATAQNGPGGMLEVLEQLPEQRKVLIHINNTNPILDEDSPERAELVRRNVEVAFDGMSIVL